MVFLPFGSCQVSRKKLRRDRNNRVTAQGDGKPIQTLLPDVVVARLACVFILRTRGVPCWIVLDIEQHFHEDGKEPANELRQLPHHPVGSLPRLCQGDNELDCEMASTLLQAIRLRNLEHTTDDVNQLPAEELGFGPGELDEHLKRFLGGGLLPAVERLREGLHH